MKFGQAENGKEREEQEHRVQEDKPRDTQPADIYGTIIIISHQRNEEKRPNAPRRTIIAVK